MIIGIGHDVTEIARISTILEGTAGSRFIERVLNLEEREYIRHKFGEDEENGIDQRQRRLHEFVAGRFAAKEAVAKALGCGIGGKLSFQDIEIMPDRLGKPHCSLSAEALERLQFSVPPIIHVSITHTEQIASAFAVIETRQVGT